VEVVSRPRYYANAQRISACVSGYMAMCKTLAPGPNGVGKRARRPFGLLLSTDAAHDIASTAIRQRPDEDVTGADAQPPPHRDDPPLAGVGTGLPPHGAYLLRWMASPVYARLCGQRGSRVTGCEITSELMRMARYRAEQRFYFVVDSACTEQAVA
jgi:N-acetylglucosaminyldiphosphoundecaprenol N-acetyl-beta-D-mannosaminyltransferase